MWLVSKGWMTGGRTTYMSITKPKIPLTIEVHNISRGSVLEASWKHFLFFAHMGSRVRTKKSGGRRDQANEHRKTS